MMQKLLLRKYRSHPSCSVTMKPVKVGGTAKTKDDMVYTFINGEYHLYHVINMEDQEMTAKEFNISPKFFRRHQTINLGATGVFNNHGYKTGLFVLDESELSGKVVMSGSLLMTVSRNILTEI